MQGCPLAVAAQQQGCQVPAVLRLLQPCCLPGTPHLLRPRPTLHRYTLNLYRPANTTAPVFSSALSAAGSTSAGVTTFTQEVQVPAGPYTLEITTANVHGAGAKTALSEEFTVGERPGGCGSGWVERLLR